MMKTGGGKITFIPSSFIVSSGQTPVY